MKEKQRQPQPDGAIISNLRYAYGMLFREYPITRLLLPLTVLVSVLFPLTGNLLPAMIVAMLEKQNLAGFAAAVAAVGMVMLLLKWGQNVLNQNLAYYTMECRNRALTMQYYKKNYHHRLPEHRATRKTGRAAERFLGNQRRQLGDWADFFQDAAVSL